MQEVWKDIKGYEGLYQISNLGRVKNIKSLRILKIGTSKGGYKIIGLFGINKIKTTKNIHTLVWDAFGDKKRSGHRIQIDHIDDNKSNNNISNLQAVTSRDNIHKIKRQNKASKYIGVHRHKDKWRSSVSVGDKRHYSKVCSTEIQAYLEYQKILLSVGQL